MISTILNVRTEQEQFDANLFAGEIFFSGPMVTDDNGLVHSRMRRLANNAEYATRILAEVKRVMIDSTAKWQIAKSTATSGALPMRVEKSISREKNEADGTDNVNLPRVQYQIVWHKDAAPVKPGYYIVPVVQLYYGHTGGWFNGQTFGCGAGARVALSVYMFDSEDGKVVFHFSADRRQVSEYQFRSNSVQMSQDLAKLEGELLRDLSRELRSL